MKIQIVVCMIFLVVLADSAGQVAKKTNMPKQQNAHKKPAPKINAPPDETGNNKKINAGIPKPISMKWHHDPFVPKKPKNCPADDCTSAVCSASPRKCLADFNNPAESSFVMKSGDRRDAWHDSRMGSCSPSCRLAMGKGGLNPKWSMSL